MSDYKQAIVNDEGELLGYDYIYADEMEQPEFEDDYYEFDGDDSTGIEE